MVKESCTNGQGMRPNSGDCSGYQMCNHGEWVSMSCADGLYWNAELGICDWPANVRCALPESPEEVVAQPEPSPPSTEAPIVSTTSPAPAASPSTTLAPAKPETVATTSNPSAASASGIFDIIKMLI